MTRVLVVDDREDNIYYLRSLLEGNGCEVESARHGAEALVKARQSPPDLVISDLLMPVMDGYTLLRHWKADDRLGAVPFIVYTATYTEAEDEQLALCLGADAFILKPAEPDAFLQRVREVQSNVAAAASVLPKSPVGDEKELLKVYSETLIRKLERKSLQLEEANRTLTRDIEERGRAEEALRLLNSAVLQSSEAVLITDAQLDLPGPRIVFVNPAFERLTGYRAEEVLGLTPRILQGPLTDRTLLARLRVILAGGGVFHGETINYRKDGTSYGVEWQVTPIRDANQTITHFGATQRDVTERNSFNHERTKHERAQREMAEQLKLERRRLVEAQQLAKVGNWETDPVTEVVIWSEQTHRIFGTDPSTFRPSHAAFLALVHPEDRARVDAAFQNSKVADGQQHIEHRLLLPSGQVKFVEERWQMLTDARGNPTKAIGTCQDISERAIAEQALQRSEQRFRSMLQNVGSVAVQSYTLDGITHYWNKASELLYGYSADEAIGRSLLDLIIPEAMHDRVRAAIQRMAQSGEPIPTDEITLCRKDGQPVTVLSSHAIVEVPGSELELFCIDVDLSERKRAERALLASEAEFRMLAESLPQLVWAADANRSINHFNRRWGDYTGLSATEISENGWQSTLHADDLEEALLRWHHATSSGANFEMELRLRRHDGDYRWMLGRAVPLRDVDGRVTKWFGTFTDIHDLKLAEIRITRLSRVQTVLSHISALNARARDHAELFQEVCRIAVEECGFRMSMVCDVQGPAQTVVPTASVGKDPQLLAAISQLLSSEESREETMTQRSVRTRQALIVNDCVGDPAALLGDRYAAMGVRSIAVFPMIVNEAVIGTLALYSDLLNYFQADEVGLFTEMSSDVAVAYDKIEKGARLDSLVYYDALTGLANRGLFLERVAQYMRGSADSARGLGVVLVDVERFKNINDSLGQAAGDSLLKQLATWLAQAVGDSNRVSRVGADQFAVVVPEESHEADVARLLERMIAGLAVDAFALDGGSFRIAAKFGVALFPADAIDAETLFKNAESALKKAKHSGQRYLFYREEMTAAVAAKLTLENQLRQAIERQEFELHYQPKVDANAREVIGAEALIRWNDPRTGQVSPGQFIPVLEETGLIHEVGRWALNQAVADFLRWRNAGLKTVRIAVNVSPLQLRHQDFASEVRQALLDTDAGAGLELEITESVIMEDVEHSMASLRAIREMGVSIAIDDFGTGFSSLGYLSRLPADKLKVDRSFINAMTAGADGLALVSSIISLAHALNLEVVAEGVETEEQSRLLRLLKCDEQQGFLFSRPLPAATFESRYLQRDASQPVAPS